MSRSYVATGWSLHVRVGVELVLELHIGSHHVVDEPFFDEVKVVLGERAAHSLKLHDELIVLHLVVVEVWIVNGLHHHLFGQAGSSYDSCHTVEFHLVIWIVAQVRNAHEDHLVLFIKVRVSDFVSLVPTEWFRNLDCSGSHLDVGFSKTVDRNEV